MRNFVLGALAMLIIGGIVAGAYIVGQKTTQKTINTTFSSNSSVVQETPSPTPTLIPTPTNPPVVVKDDDLILQALFTKNGWKPPDGITIKVSTNDGKYASGTVGGQGGGGYFYAAKVNGVWEIVADGNGTITCQQVNKYPDFPKTLIPECWDQATGALVKR